MDVVIQIFVGVILIVLAYTLITILVMLIGKKTKDEAIKTTVDFVKKTFKEFFSSENVAVNSNFPVSIGWNGYTIREDIVNNAFEKLEKYWEFVNFEFVITSNPNVLIYQFRVYNQIDKNLSKKNLLIKVRRTAEQALTKHFQSQNIFVSVDKFVAVALSQDILRVAFATNNEGFALVSQLRRNQQ